LVTRANEVNGVVIIRDVSTTEMARALLMAASGEGPRLARATVIEGAGDLATGSSFARLETGEYLGDSVLQPLVMEILADALDGGTVGTLAIQPGGASVYVEIVEPEVMLIVVGGGHIGRSLSYIASHVGFSVTVIDDRADYANRERFPEADRVICDDFVAALQSLPLGPTSYVVIVTRGHKQDEQALAQVVGSKAGYVGMIGSKRRVSAVFQHLIEEGISPASLERVHSPIGVDIGAETPEEIAVSIIAEIIGERRKAKLRSLSAVRPKAATRRRS
jgi:xanthine dehydrogenase accessory factor